MRKVYNYILIMIIFCCLNQSVVGKEHNKIKEITLNWEEIDGALSYKVQVQDNKGVVILDKTVTSSTIKLLLKPGSYNIRIGVINKFEKIDAWSDWRNLTIVKQKEKAAVSLGIRLSLGFVYATPLSDWGDIYDNSYKTGLFRLGFYFGDMALFNRFFIAKYSALEFEAAYASLDGEYVGNYDTNLALTQFGANLILKTNFNFLFDINFLLRAGGGIASSKQSFERFDLTTASIVNDTITTRDPYYKVGLGVNHFFSKAFYIEAGADYNVVRYLSPPHLKFIQYSFALGVKF